MHPVNLETLLVPLQASDAPQPVCAICDVLVDENTKHCMRCNKCIQHFDHHCLYMNTCVGGRNYRHFIVLSTICLVATAGQGMSGAKKCCKHALVRQAPDLVFSHAYFSHRIEVGQFQVLREKLAALN